MQLDHLAAEIGILKALTDNVENISAIAAYMEHDGCRKVGEFTRGHRRVYTNDDTIARQPVWRRVVDLKP
jgi:hypothetical protein